jgi:2-C-methyl-D-erythritol 4-phosphate cytidylyltransferase
MTWVVVPAAGRGLRFGDPLPKQYVALHGEPVIAHTLRALLTHPRVDGAVVVLAAGDEHWPGWPTIAGKPLLTAVGAPTRAGSVLAGLQALPGTVADAELVLVHDAARPLITHADLDALLAVAEDDAVGAILAAPLRDTLKRAIETAEQVTDAVHPAIAATVPRAGLWRALTPQAFRRGALVAALADALAANVEPTDEAMAMERLGHAPRLVEGSEDNLKITTRADLDYAVHRLTHRS